jgi:hypothetical protein
VAESAGVQGGGRETAGTPRGTDAKYANARFACFASDLHENHNTTTKYITTAQFKDKKSSSTESPEQRDSARE